MSEKARCYISASAKLQECQVSLAKLSANFLARARSRADKDMRDLAELQTIVREARAGLDRLRCARESEWQEANDCLSKNFGAFDSLWSRLPSTDSSHNKPNTLS